MLVKANVSFCGRITMFQGQEIDLPPSAELDDLIRCGYVEKTKNEEAQSEERVVGVAYEKEAEEVHVDASEKEAEGKPKTVKTRAKNKK